MEKIKVAFFAEILIEEMDGASRTMFQLIKRINRDRFDFLFIYGSGPDQVMDFESMKIPALTLPLNTNYTIALPALIKATIKDRLKAFSPQVIHIATPSILGNFALKYALKNKIPVISIYHTHFISYIDYYLKYMPFLIKEVKKIVAKGQKKFYNSCDLIYVPSISISDELTGIGIEDKRIKLWKRGIDTTLFSSLNRDTSFMEELTGNNYPTLMFASRLVWEKNLETLIKIYEELQSKDVPLNFLVVGDGIAAKACKSIMKNALFTGTVDHQTLAVLYASASVFVFPSVSETYGNVVIEAMASGLPCVIADGGGSRDFIVQGINGFKCPPYDSADYVQKIMLLLENNTLRTQFSMLGQQLGRQLSWEQLAEVYFNDLKALSGSAAAKEEDQ